MTCVQIEFELLVDQPFRQLEGVESVELVEQLALHLLARGAGEVGGDPAADHLFQPFEAFETEPFGEFVVDRERLALGHRLHGRLEVRRLAGERTNSVGLGEGRVNCPLFADGGAEELLLETRNEGVRTEHHLDVAAGAALERFALDRPVEIDGHAVMILRLRALGLVLVGAPLLGDPVERGVDVGVLDVGSETLDRNLGEIADFEHRQNFEGDLEIEVAARLERRVDHRLVGRQLDLRLAGEAQVIVVDDLLVGVGDSLLDDVGHDRLPIDLAQMFDRHFPGTEAVDADLPLEVGQLSVQLLREVARRQRNVILALEPLAQRLRHLHCPIRLVFARRVP